MNVDLLREVLNEYYLPLCACIGAGFGALFGYFVGRDAV